MSEREDDLTRDAPAIRDCSAEAAASIAAAQKALTRVVKRTEFEESMADLFLCEKMARQACDAKSTSLLCAKILYLARQYTEDVDYCLELLNSLTKKRGQLKAAVVSMVQTCEEWSAEIQEDSPLWFRIRLQLTELSEGKIYLEVPRARLLLSLAESNMRNNDLPGACKLLQDLPIETFNGMEAKEQAEFVLEQLRLVMLNEDWIRAQIVSRKISPKLLDSEEMQGIKLRFNEMMVEFNLHEKDYWEASQCYLKLLEIESVAAVPEKLHSALEDLVVFLALCDKNDAQLKVLSDLKTTYKKPLQRLPHVQSLLDDLLDDNVIAWPLSDRLLSLSVLSEESKAENRQHALRRRVVQHNIFVFSKFYTKVTLTRISDVINIPKLEVEQEVCELVSSDALQAKIDRPTDELHFLDPTNKLDMWGASITKAVGLVDEICHLIEKEKVIYAANLKRKQLLARVV
ncbi:MAG: uncharacterized protein KVP18_002496 [Porospora cf. gigantea A]|uniref:uncharacterized protein n=1 Tax=Porospora cf. gigantea A TaxID=2853593 RepID=UPI00355A952B|nr:MAG: hypothetical protein KVP18_002496 [Porospora cf. gigantea A]